MSKLADKIGSRTFVVTTELTPPKGIDLTVLLGKATELAAHVDAINLTESPRARMAIEPTAVARLMIERGIEPIVQFTARDRNRIALQSDVLGAAALGVENMVFMTGDAPSAGDHPEAKPVFDLTTLEMLHAARALAGGHDLAGNALNGAPRLYVGATANPGNSDPAIEVRNARAKIDAGARFLQTQALYDTQSLEWFMNAVKPDAVAVLAGIIPLKSGRMARWLNANVPGIIVPDALITEMDRHTGNAEAELAAGIEIAARIIRAIRPYCAGIHLMTMGWERHLPQILGLGGVR